MYDEKIILQYSKPPFTIIPVKRDVENKIRYYRIFGRTIEYDASLPKYTKVEEILSSPYYRLKPGNGGFQHLLDTKKFINIVYDLYLIKRNPDGSILRPVVPIIEEKESTKLIATEIIESIGGNAKEIVAMDTEFRKNKDDLVVPTEIGIVNSIGDVVFDVRVPVQESTIDKYEDPIVYMSDKVVVGYNVNSDLNVLKITNQDVYDVQDKFKDEKGTPFKLRDMVMFFFGDRIQKGKHTAIVDAFYTLKLLSVFPCLKEIMLPRSVVHFVNSYGSGRFGHQLFMNEFKLLEMDKIFLREQEDYRRKQLKKEMKNKLKTVPGFRDFDTGLMNDIGKRRVIENFLSSNPDYFQMLPDEKVPEMTLLGGSLYEMSYSDDVGWSSILLDDLELDAVNLFGITYGSFILSKDDGLRRIWLEKYDEILFFKDYLNVLYRVVFYDKSKYEVFHNYVRWDYREVLRDFYSDSILKYLDFCSLHRRKLVVWGDITEWMIIVDVK